MNCIFVGDEFYERSKTIMSPIYKIEPGGYSRTDWGKVNVCLRNGESVNIRPATSTEKERFLLKLHDLEKELKEQGV